MSRFRDLEEQVATKDEGWGSVESRIVLQPELRDGLRGLAGYDRVESPVSPAWVAELMRGYL